MVLQMVVKSCQCVFDRGRLVDHKNTFRQVIENRRVQWAGEWHQKFPAGKCFALVSKIGAVLEIAFESVVGKPFAGEERPVLEILWCYGDLTHRSDADLRKLSGRKLSFGVERSYRIDRIAKELNSHWSISIRRPDINDPAANRELTWPKQWFLANITAGKQGFDQSFGCKIFITRQFTTECGDLVRRHGSLYQRTRRQNYEIISAAPHLPQRQCTSFLSFGVGRNT